MVCYGARETPSLPAAAFLLAGLALILEVADARTGEAPTIKPLTVKVAAIQCSSELGAVATNRARLTAVVKQAAAQGAKIIVLPETSITGYLSQDLRVNWYIQGKPLEPAFIGKDPSLYAEEVPGPSTQHFSELAKQLGVYITVPFMEVVYPSKPGTLPSSPTNSTERAAVARIINSRSGSRYYNTVCLVSPAGQVVAHYRKLTPWPYPEKSWATPGDLGVQTYDTEYGRVGLAICYDIHTILEKYEPRHIWALLYPIAWVDNSHPADWFWHRLPERLAPFKHYLIGANWSVDNPQPWHGYGFSEILSPKGEILASSHRLYGTDIVYATIPTQWAEE
jgi:predicted amidohydrolase